MEFLNQQFNQQRHSPRNQSLWQQTRTARTWFLAGLVVGILFGWFFHGIVSLFVRLGFLVLLLIPLFIIGWLFLRSRRGPDEEQPGPRVYTFGNLPFGGSPFGNQSGEPAPRRDEDPVIQLNDEDYDLERFKRKLERER
jgi:hypothetical protein